MNEATVQQTSIDIPVKLENEQTGNQKKLAQKGEAAAEAQNTSAA